MKKLLFSLIFAGISVANLSAQSKTWDFSDTAKFAAGAISTDTTIDGLSFVTGGSNLTIATNSLATFGDGYAPTQRLQFGGNSYGGSTNPAVGATSMPTRRYTQFAVAGNAVIRLWARGGGAGRSILISDGTGKVLSSTTFAGNGTSDIAIISYTYTGAAGNVIVSTGGGDNSLYKIEYTDNSTLAVGETTSEIKANAFSVGNKIYVKDLASKNTMVNVYSANGMLVKSLRTSADTDFEINGRGVYFINLKTDVGERSVKVLLR
ncbi:T9SS type A sorting domain-containing protein [Epilithonimonas caeni]|uniref:T9SS type A sorting domain-containing protein n=1 Tax=Epilithonimonas caeni TaxID=365343 RepID=UPI0004276D2F|nr:T9SS type A sorting domain-containing protein [Epilithonimonas caeni]